jgi:hypothetical protein
MLRRREIGQWAAVGNRAKAEKEAGLPAKAGCLTSLVEKAMPRALDV